MLAVLGGQTVWAASDGSSARVAIGNSANTLSDTSDRLQEVTVTAHRIELEKRVAKFVNQVAATENGAEGLARWEAPPACLLVSGLPRQDGEFILERLSDVAHAVGIPLGDEHCHPNLYILVTPQPEDLLRGMEKRNRAYTFGYNPSLRTETPASVVDEFIRTPRPVRVWYNSNEKDASGHALSYCPAIEIALIACAPSDTECYPPHFDPSRVYECGRGAAGGTHLSFDSLWWFARVFVIVDQRQLHEVTLGQLADYVAMAGFAKLKPGAHLDDAPTILTLFSGASESAPGGMTEWDHAFLKSLYATEQKSKLQRSQIAHQMAHEIGSRSFEHVRVLKQRVQDLDAREHLSVDMAILKRISGHCAQVKSESMAKSYGGRWRITGPRLGQGGQSEVFRVVDETGQVEGEYALKRVLNPKRHERFRTEVDAIERLQHPNIIKLVDHSALDVGEGGQERQYLVMPIAVSGSLADPGRVSLYKEDIDATVRVALQLAAALEAAHAADIIHRDVKPANVLFTGNGHEIWLSDFGICLIREIDRNTELDEVVGPRSFMAPELEAGGQLEVTPSADVYSLGKVIYFMISGGTILPREELGDPRFSKVFERGDRYRRLQLLLTRMVCPLERRMKSMTDVIAQLKAIEAWEQSAMSLALDPSAREGIARLQGLALRNQQAAADLAAARASRDQLVASVRQAFSSWAEVELKKIAVHIGTPQIATTVLPIALVPSDPSVIQLSDRSHYEVLSGWELVLETREPLRGDALQLLLCVKRKVTVRVSVGPAASLEPNLAPPELAVVSAYARPPAAGGPGAPPRRAGFLTRRQSVGQVVQHFETRPGHRSETRSANLHRVASIFRPEHSLCTPFKADEWNVALERVRTQLEESLGVFVDFVTEVHPSIGL